MKKKEFSYEHSFKGLHSLLYSDISESEWKQIQKVGDKIWISDETGNEVTFTPEVKETKKFLIMNDDWHKFDSKTDDVIVFVHDLLLTKLSVNMKTRTITRHKYDEKQNEELTDVYIQKVIASDISQSELKNRRNNVKSFQEGCNKLNILDNLHWVLNAHAADVVEVSGRVGAKSDMNGIYYKQISVHEGRVWYQKQDSDWHIRWYPKSQYWFIDSKPKNTGNKAIAYVHQDIACAFVEWVTEVWNVADNGFQEDTNVKVTAYIQSLAAINSELECTKENILIEEKNYTPKVSVNELEGDQSEEEAKVSDNIKIKKNKKKKKNKMVGMKEEKEDKIQEETEIDQLKLELAEWKKKLKEAAVFHQKTLQEEKDQSLQKLKEIESSYQQTLQAKDFLYLSKMEDYKKMKEEEITRLKSNPYLDHEKLKTLSLDVLKNHQQATSAYSKKIETEIQIKEEQEANEKLCSLCLNENNKKDHAIIPCGHCFCQVCSQDLIDRNLDCATCRGNIDGKVKVYY